MPGDAQAGKNTSAHHSYLRATLIPVGAIPHPQALGHTGTEQLMQSTIVESDKRRQDRTKAVLPVKVRGRDRAGKCFEELVHTLDVTPMGARLGAVRHCLKALDPLTILYRQRRIEFRVVWIKKLEGADEYQVGLQALMQDHDAWGLNLSDFRVRNNSITPSAVSLASGVL
jgi:hypothetical protein